MRLGRWIAISLGAFVALLIAGLWSFLPRPAHIYSETEIDNTPLQIALRRDITHEVFIHAVNERGLESVLSDPKIVVFASDNVVEDSMLLNVYARGGDDATYWYAQGQLRQRHRASGRSTVTRTPKGDRKN